YGHPRGPGRGTPEGAVRGARRPPGGSYCAPGLLSHVWDRRAVLLSEPAPARGPAPPGRDDGQPPPPRARRPGRLDRPPDRPRATPTRDHRHCRGRASTHVRRPRRLLDYVQWRSLQLPRAPYRARLARLPEPYPD